MGVTNRGAGASKIFLKIYSKEPGVDQTAAFFGKQEKIDGKWGVVERFDTVSGTLVSIEHVENEYKGEKYNAVRMLINDNGLIQVEATFNSLAYNILNSLASVNSFNGELSISLYVNKNGYATAYITLDKEKLSWKYSVEELPKRQTATVGKKTVTDSTELEEFFVKVIGDIQSVLGEVAAAENHYAESIANAPESPLGTAEYDFDEPDDSDLPF